jgi:Fe-S-cluster-containing hydrogenase component 2
MFCARNCASDAIFEEEGKAVIDRSKCSRCYCCHELCPHGAVDIKDPPKVAGAILDGFFNVIGK